MPYAKQGRIPLLEIMMAAGVWYVWFLSFNYIVSDYITMFYFARQGNKKGLVGCF